MSSSISWRTLTWEGPQMWIWDQTQKLIPRHGVSGRFWTCAQMLCLPCHPPFIILMSIHVISDKKKIYISKVSYTVAFFLKVEIKNTCFLHLTQRVIVAVWLILDKVYLGTRRRSRHVLRHHDLFHADHDHDFYLFHAELTMIMVRGLLIMVRGLHEVTWHNLFHAATILPVYVVLDPLDNLCLQIWTGPLKMPNLDHMMLDLQTQSRLIFYRTRVRSLVMLVTN